MLRKMFGIGLLVSLSIVLTALPLTAQDTPSGSVTLNGISQVTRADIQASNGVIHVIDTVLLAPGLEVTNEAQMTEEMLATEEGTEEAGATDEASGTEETDFGSIGATTDAQLEEINATNTALFGEISGTSTALAGEISMTGTAIQEEIVTTGTAIQLEIQTTGTAIQAEILGTPPATEDMAATDEMMATDDPAATEETEMTSMTVIEVLQSEPELSTAYAAIEAAGLAETLRGAGPFTLFIPDNAAFEAYLAERETTVEEIFANTQGLTDLLLYHVVEGQYLASDLPDQTILTTLRGTDIIIGTPGEENMDSSVDSTEDAPGETPESTPES